MKNIFEDDVLPSSAEKPPVLKSNVNRNMPARPKRQVTPTPKQQERQAIQQGYIPVPPQGQPIPQMQPVPQGQQPIYQYIPVNPQYPVQPQSFPQQSVAYYPVFDQGNQQPVYPQQIPVQYVPYGTYPQPPQQDAPKGEYNPGTRVLFQSPDFENKDGSSFTDNVGANFADSVKSAAYSKEAVSDDDSQDENNVDFEEVSLDFLKRSEIKKPTVIKAESPSEEITSADSNKGDISFAAYNAVKPSLEVEDFEQDLPPYEEDANEEDDNEADVSEKKALPKSEIIRRVVLAIAIVAIVISAGMLINEWRLSRENDEVMEEAGELILTESSKDDEEDQTTKPMSSEEQWQKIKKDYPDVLFPATIQLKYAKLYGENQDFIGYISADGIGLNLPVVQTTDNEKYLNKNFYGKSTKYGCPFVSYRNRITSTSLDLNTVIFGHHMNNGTIFGALDKYKTISGYKKAPVISFNTLYNDYQWKVFAVIITNGNSTGDNNYLFPYDFTTLSSQAKFSSYLNELAQRSLYDTGVDVLPTDKILTLSTCSHEFEDARLVVVARLVRPGESTSVDTSKAVSNSKPRYPQAYYNKKGITNPYKNASRWFAN